MKEEEEEKDRMKDVGEKRKVWEGMMSYRREKTPMLHNGVNVHIQMR